MRIKDYYCTDCRLSEHRRYTVICRGRTQAHRGRHLGQSHHISDSTHSPLKGGLQLGYPKRVDIVFIGEAPGKDENALGVPFIGRAGEHLTQIINFIDLEFTFDITNVVRCIPYNDDGGVTQPKEDEIEACKPHLERFLEITQPKGLVLLGEVAQKNVKTNLPSVHIVHPAYIARQEFKVLLLKKAAFTIEDFIKPLLA